jgi:hypothetical protein
VKKISSKFSLPGEFEEDTSRNKKVLGPSKLSIKSGVSSKTTPKINVVEVNSKTNAFLNMSSYQNVYDSN